MGIEHKVLDTVTRAGEDPRSYAWTSAAPEAVAVSSDPNCGGRFHSPAPISSTGLPRSVEGSMPNAAEKDVPAGYYRQVAREQQQGSF